MINKELLAKLCEVAGAPGHENRVRKIVLDEIKPFVDEISIDNMVMLLLLRREKKRKKL